MVLFYNKSSESWQFFVEKAATVMMRDLCMV